MPRPNRGDVWLVDLGYVGKTRPAVVLEYPTIGGRSRFGDLDSPHN